MTYVYLWEYVVAADRLAEFERTYGPSGEWVRLFRGAAGYLRTELHRDRANAGRFVTVDYWESAAAWEAFRAERAREFEALDARCEALTESEREIGRFETVAGQREDGG
jgi:quinol monooxygenase YgiN